MKHISQIHSEFMKLSKLKFDGRIMNVDLILELRIAGNSEESIRIDTDEGDGYTFFTNNNSQEPENQHYEEWIGQLEHIIDILKEHIK
jgi:hypothetical protein